ncbi:MAG: preprotein translocase subunit SecE [Acidobacteriaceae bacterium]
MAKAVVVADEQGALSQWKSIPQRMMSFLSDVRGEMKKVVTPSRDEVQTTTIVVIITVFMFAAYFFLVDKILGTVIEWALQQLTGH